MEKQFYLGIDVSTQGAKAVVIDTVTHYIPITEGVNFDKELPQYGTVNGVIPHLGDGVSESNPEMWLDGLKLLFNKVKQSGFDLSRIAAIAVSGQQHGLVTIDTNGNLTRARSKLWNDVSTETECAEIIERAGGIEVVNNEICNSIKPGYTAGKILHFKKENYSAYAQTATVFLVHNYINWFLTGGRTGGVRIMEPGDVSGMALWNPSTKGWSKPILNAIDPTLESKLPPVVPTETVIGFVGKSLCAEYGFSEKCKIFAGSGDNMYSAVGTGNVVPGMVSISLGTSGTACTILNAPYTDPKGEIASYFDAFGNYMALLCVSNLANGYNHIRSKYNLSHDAFEEILTLTAPGNGGRILLPWFVGERTPDLPHAVPCYFGFYLDDFTPEILARAVLEGHILNLYEGFASIPAKPKELRLTGGIAKSKAWRQTIADIFGLPVRLAEGEGAALGAAIHAAFADSEEVSRSHTRVAEFVNQFVHIDENSTTYPNKTNEAIYSQCKECFRSLSAGVRSVQKIRL